MIGVISNEEEVKWVREFFELFKTPWGVYAPDRYYDVVVSTQSGLLITNARLVISYISGKSGLDHIQGINIQSERKKGLVEGDGIELPIYGNCYGLVGEGKAILRVKGSSDVVGLETESAGGKRIFFGFSLFEEICFLLSEGQPKENAHIPTIEMHISVLRNSILNAGILLVEVPPVPAGCDFIVCLTHDMDFAGIRNHRLDHTMFGFLYRASVGSLLRLLKGNLTFEKLMRNWKAVLSLPFVYLGFEEDFWFQLDEYARVEKDMKSTFFLIPFKNQPANDMSVQSHKHRAAKYDISDISKTAKTLAENGFEIGVHGIDAWHDLEKARRELDRVVEFCDGSEIGVRIHWLLFNNDSYRILDEAGFSYDSSCGYNEAVGYRAGTVQVFKPFNTNRLLELPLHIQDTALFYRRRMNLSEREALDLCDKLIGNAKSHGGVLTILWHDRSLAPERLWGDFYINLLGKIKENKVWFATAGEIVNWFRRRREVIFKKVDIDDDKIRLSVKYDNNGSSQTKEPFVFVRIYHPKLRKSNEQNTLMSGFGYTDVPLKGETSFEINLNSLNP